ncbi:MAG: oxidoreductase [Verrucomicrobia bacterium]|nr:oxidoreductase [Verrucomicrobiota bacterium]
MKIVVNNTHTIESSAGKTLLDLLKDAGIFLPSGCGGRGACGMCRVKVASGKLPPLTKPELFWLSKTEQDQGFRLACRINPDSDLAIDVPEDILAIRGYDTEVISLRDLTYDVKEVTLRLLHPPEIRFRAGQFVQLKVPPYELTPQPVYRAYSIASNPLAAEEITLHVRFVPNGISTTYVHHHLKVGDRVSVNGPHGRVYLRESNNAIIFIAGGSGMAPIRSMLFELLNRKSTRRAIYFFGARTCRDLFLVDEMAQFAERLPDFTFVPAISDPQPADMWCGERGLITEVVARHVVSGANTEAYLCGSPVMINACLKVLGEKGVPEEMIFYDKFV